MILCCSLLTNAFNLYFVLFRYDERIDRVETRITARLRDQLGTAKNANEMFRIFSRFNALFVRPHIRGAIREYQTQLIQRVKVDIESLHEKFKVFDWNNSYVQMVNEVYFCKDQLVFSLFQIQINLIYQDIG